jgi:hypothetical protein
MAKSSLGDTIIPGEGYFLEWLIQSHPGPNPDLATMQ